MSMGLSMGDFRQDPFLVSAHIITDPGEAKTLQCAVDRLLSLLHPQLTLFRVSERAESSGQRPQCLTNIHLTLRPCLSVILFLQEDYVGDESQEQQLKHPPWHYHHTEHVKGLALPSVMQDFFILAPGTPLWALRQVNYGKEIVRFTMYCRYETYSDQVRLYRLLLHRPLVQRNRIYCLFVVYSNHHMETQLSFKRLPRGEDPAPTESTLMEIRVRNIWGLIPLLPFPCRPISDIRWQTKDYDGNKILLQAQGSSEQSRDTIPSSPSSETPSFSSIKYSPDFYQKCFCQNTLFSDIQSPLRQSPLPPIPLQCKQENMESVWCSQNLACAGWTDLYSHSQISVATESFHSVSTCPSTSLPFSSCLTIPRFRINVDALLGAKETDVDTGQSVISRSVDLSVVSAYLLPQTKIISKGRAPQPLSEPSKLVDITSSLKLSNETALHALQGKSFLSKSEHQNNDSDITVYTEENRQEFFI